MKAQLKQSNVMFTYEGDYSFLHKEEKDAASKNSYENQLMWLKRNSYKQNKSNSAIGTVHKNLIGLKINGYKQQNAGASSMSKKATMYVTQPLHETVYQQMQSVKAKSKFYFETMSMLIILNLVFFLAFIHH